MDSVAVQSKPFGAILVVDDDEANRVSLSRRLERRGYTVASAESGVAALRCVAERKFDLVLLDVMMPGMNGLEVLERIRQTHSQTDLCVVMATANQESQDIVEALTRGANDYVIKPLDFPVVLARIQTQLLMKKSVDQVLDLERRLSARNVELESANKKLSDVAARTRIDLEAAAKVQEAFLPAACPDVAGLKCAWRFRPCQELAGDSLNIFTVDADHVGFYVLDVTGHGVAASLLAVAANRFLAPSADADSILLVAPTSTAERRPATPSEVAERLNRKLICDAGVGQFLTLFYALLNPGTGALSYVSAGHPSALLMGSDGSIRLLEGSGMPIGIGARYEHQAVQLRNGDRVFLYSDGVTEAMNPESDLFGTERLLGALMETRKLSLEQSIDFLLERVDRWRRDSPAKDDVSILAVELRS